MAKPFRRGKCTCPERVCRAATEVDVLKPDVEGLGFLLLGKEVGIRLWEGQRFAIIYLWGDCL